MNSSHRRGVSTPIALLVAALLAGGLFVWLFFFAKPDSTFDEQGEEIVAALEQYRADSGAYPETLLPLVPARLPALPVPIDGNAANWVYGLDPSGEFFTLTYLRPGERGRVYTSSTKQWEADAE